MTIRSRILLVFLLALASGFFALERWLSLELRPRYYQSFEEPLVDMANILAELASAEFAKPTPDFTSLYAAFERVYQRNPQADIYGLNKTSIDIRLYITNREGVIIFDSYRQALGADFADWRDVYLTLRGRYGARSSSMTKLWQPHDEREAHSIAYVAAPIYRDHDLVGVLSIGKPKANVTQFIATARRDLLWSVFGMAVLVVLTVTLLYLWISRPLHQVAQFAKRIAQGETLAMPDLGRNEIGSVAHAIADMRTALDGKRYIERYTQTLAHELKSPLTSIKAAAELLLEDMPSAQRQRFITSIQAENERALTLIQRLLELAALENRQGVIDKKPVALKPLLSDIAQALQATLLQKAITLNLNECKDLVVMGERFLLKQALFNIIDNALAFSPTTSQINISAISNQQQTVIAITDQGAGIPDYAQARVFERFYSLPRPDTQNRSSGLGLSFVKEVMELHQGAVSLYSNGNGTTVTLTFPI